MDCAICFAGRRAGLLLTSKRYMVNGAWPWNAAAEELMLRGCRKVDNWAIIQNLVPSGDAIFEVGSAAGTLERLALLPGEERVVAAVDGVKDVATVARESGSDAF